MNSVKSSFMKFVTNPFRYYLRAAGFTFCLTSATNFVTSFTNSERFSLMTQHPHLFSNYLLMKSAYYGVNWPAFYLGGIRNPQNVLTTSSIDDQVATMAVVGAELFDGLTSTPINGLTPSPPKTNNSKN